MLQHQPAEILGFESINYSITESRNKQMGAKIDITGRRFGSLTATKPTSNRNNQEKLFSLPSNLYEGYVSASMAKSEAEINDILSQRPSKGDELSKEEFATSGEQLTNEYPQQASSLFNLILEVESKAK